MRHAADILEHPQRRPYHLLVGSFICFVIGSTVLVGVRVVLG